MSQPLTNQCSSQTCRSYHIHHHHHQHRGWSNVAGCPLRVVGRLLLLLLLLLLKLLLSLILCSCVCVHAFVKQEEALKVCGLLAQLHTASGRWLCAIVARGSGPPRTCYVCVFVRFLLTSLSCPLELVPTATKKNCTRGS